MKPGDLVIARMRHPFYEDNNQMTTDNKRGWIERGETMVFLRRMRLEAVARVLHPVHGPIRIDRHNIVGAPR